MVPDVDGQDFRAHRQADRVDDLMADAASWARYLLLFCQCYNLRRDGMWTNGGESLIASPSQVLG